MNRYDFHLVHGAGHMRPRKHGEWVRYEDAQAEIKRLQALADERGRRMEEMYQYGEFPNWKEVHSWFDGNERLK